MTTSGEDPVGVESIAAQLLDYLVRGEGDLDGLVEGLRAAERSEPGEVLRLLERMGALLRAWDGAPAVERVNSPKGRARVERLVRRAEFVEARAQGRTGYDAAEASALRWAVAKLEALGGLAPRAREATPAPREVRAPRIYLPEDV